MKEPPKFIQICPSNDPEYLFFGLTDGGEIFGLLKGSMKSYYDTKRVPDRWWKITAEYK